MIRSVLLKMAGRVDNKTEPMKIIKEKHLCSHRSHGANELPRRKQYEGGVVFVVPANQTSSTSTHVSVLVSNKEHTHNIKNIEQNKTDCWWLLYIIPQGCCSGNPRSSQASPDSRRGGGGGGHRDGGRRSNSGSGGRTARNSAAAAVLRSLACPVLDRRRAQWHIYADPINGSGWWRVHGQVIVTAWRKALEESGDFIAISCQCLGVVKGTNAGIYHRTAAPGGDGTVQYIAATALQSAHQDSRQGDSDSHREDTHCRGLHTEPISGQWGELAVLNWESLREESHWSALRRSLETYGWIGYPLVNSHSELENHHFQ